MIFVYLFLKILELIVLDGIDLFFFILMFVILRIVLIGVMWILIMFMLLMISWGIMIRLGENGLNGLLVSYCDFLGNLVVCVVFLNFIMLFFLRISFFILVSCFFMVEFFLCRIIFVGKIILVYFFMKNLYGVFI